MTTREDVARLALGLPGVAQADHFAAPSFGVKGKAFAILREEGRVTLKLDPEDQANLMLARPGVVEPVSGGGARVEKAARQGWSFVRYELCDAAEMERLLRLAWEEVAGRG